MKHTLAFFCILIVGLACSFSSTPPTAPTPDSVPETLQIVNSEDGLDELLAFVESVKQIPSVRFGTIEEAAIAWDNAGGVPIQIP